MMSLWDALRMNMMISYQELVRTFPNRNIYYSIRHIINCHPHYIFIKRQHWGKNHITTHSTGFHDRICSIIFSSRNSLLSQYKKHIIKQ